MSTQRPFFANFVAAFRAHSAIQQGKATAAPSSSSHQPTHTSPSQPRTITTSTKPSTGATTTALTSLHSPRTHSTSSLSRSPGPGSSSGPMSPSDNAGGRYMTTSRGRRESDSSSEGFRDVLGAEKWYIGGRTAAGEERYFKLGVVRRQTSRDRLSLDRLSL
ncbi:hypothetical protein BDZ45DRAFT_342187 [Acephala macrosclerotiorum]|nr:hypothetical protein BDZ45DRAFT_342187 [Acephala macrosclerotiorum]